MELTPFDVTSPTPNISANLPPSRSPRKKNKWLFLIPLLVLLIAGGSVGTVYLQKQNEIRAREEKLAALRQDIKRSS
jgi:flagellar basal body-associated protein FliL